MVTLWSAKPTCGGSIPPQASKLTSVSFCLQRYAIIARVVELVYTHDLKSCPERDAGSIPAPGTTVKNMDKKYPKFVVGAFIMNKNNELFLWKNKHGFVCPNFKLLLNKTIEDTFRDGIKEKTGFKITKHIFIDLIEGLNIKIDNIGNTTHLIFADYKITISNENDFNPPAKYSDREYKWLKPREWLELNHDIFGSYITNTIKHLV